MRVRNPDGLEDDAVSLITIFDERNQLRREVEMLRGQLAEAAHPAEENLDVVALKLVNERQAAAYQRLRAENNRLTAALNDQQQYAQGILRALQSWHDAVMSFWPSNLAFDPSNAREAIGDLVNVARLDGFNKRQGKGATNYLYSVQLALQTKHHQVRALQERLRNVRREYRRDRKRLQKQIDIHESTITDLAREASDGL